jgi:uncharacterized protein (TIGR00106 family)
MLLAEFSIWPMDKGQSVSPYVARCLDIIDRSGLPYRLGPMGTALEGEYDQVMAVLKQCFDALLADCSRVTASVKLDYRKGYTGRLDAKVRRVEDQVGRKLRT